jgi:hypothetical protein
MGGRARRCDSVQVSGARSPDRRSLRGLKVRDVHVRGALGPGTCVCVCVLRCQWLRGCGHVDGCLGQWLLCFRTVVAVVVSGECEVAVRVGADAQHMVN